MRGKVIVVMAVLACLGGPAMAQMTPDSNMAAPAGANNGIGHQGGLTAQNGSHSSTVRGEGGAARIPVRPKPTARPGNSQDLENEPALGGGRQK